MTDLTEANLTSALEAIQNHIKETGKSIVLRPTKVMYRPAELAALGLTHEDVVKMIKENT
jgi:hypothetical protein